MMVLRFPFLPLLASFVCLSACGDSAPFEEAAPTAQDSEALRRGSDSPSLATITTPYFRSIWGSSASDVWAVGDNGLLMRFNGTSWKRFANPAGTNVDMLAVWGSSANNVWAVG